MVRNVGLQRNHISRDDSVQHAGIVFDEQRTLPVDAARPTV
jgi:hypothetical protein